MSYSCTAAANNSLADVMKCSDSKSSNAWEHENGFIYFYEIGKEHADGAITGSVYKVTTDGSACSPASFRINPDGYIKRFPNLNKKMRKQMHLINNSLSD